MELSEAPIFLPTSYQITSGRFILYWFPFSSPAHKIVLRNRFHNASPEYLIFVSHELSKARCVKIFSQNIFASAQLDNISMRQTAKSSSLGRSQNYVSRLSLLTNIRSKHSENIKTFHQTAST